jgi:hypothetical protein
MTDVTKGLSGIGDMAAKLQTGSASQSLDIGSLLGNMSMTTIIVSLVAGLVGMGYFMYGKKTCNFTMLLSGVALCIVPYFIGNTLLLVFACAAMTAVPFVIACYT